MTRRDFARVLALPSLVPAIDTDQREWRAGNNAIEQVLRLEQGRFFCASLRNRDSGREWIHPAVPSLEFLVEGTLGGKPFRLTGEGPWQAGEHIETTAGGWRRIVIELKSTSLPFRISREYLVHERLPVLRSRTTIHNDGSDPAVLNRVDTFNLRVAPSPEPLALEWINNFGRAMIPSPSNPIHSCSMVENVRQVVRTGPYSPDFGWFSLAMPGTGERLVGGWEWSGPMAVAFGDLVDPCPIQGGLDAEGMHEPLAPGASFRAPVGWYGFAKSSEDAAALSHALVRTALGPPLPPRDFPWVGYCTWSCSLDEKSPYNEAGTHPWFPTEKNLLSQVEAAAEIGCELYLWDYGWFPFVGEWRCDPKRFPDGPKPVVRAVKSRGMKVGLWMGFGNADERSTVAREHPDWLAMWKGRPIPDKFFTRTGASTWNTRILCLAHRPAREWVKDQISRVVESFELDWLKHDFDLVTMCDSDDHTHTPGDSRIAACEGFYEVMDFVRSRYPALVCENWTNNSAVPDYGVLRRHHVQLIGDAYSAFVLRQMFYGHLMVFPADRQHRYVRFEDSAGDLKTMLRSGFLGGPCTLLSDPRLLAPAQRRLLAAEIERYKKWRDLFAAGAVYALAGRPHPRSWDATEFHAPALGRAMVLAFRNDQAGSERTFPLRGLDSGARYQVELVDSHQTYTASGRELLEKGVKVVIAERNRSEIVLLTREGAG
jgi:alpha-galactosidase